MKTPAQGLQAQVEGTGDPGGLGTQSLMGPRSPPRAPGRRAVGPGSLTEGVAEPTGVGGGRGTSRRTGDGQLPPADGGWARRVSPPGSSYLAWLSRPRLQARPSRWASTLSSLCWTPLELFQAPGEDTNRLARRSHAPAHGALPAGASWPCVLW